MSEGVIHVVDDDAAIRASLAFLLTTADFTVRTYESAQALLAQRDTLGRGCIVSDIRMPGMSGLELVQELRSRRIDMPVIALTGHGDVALATAAMRAGMAGFLEKPFDDEALLGAIHAAMTGDTHAQAAERADVANKRARLTARERDVFDAVVSGQSNQQVATRLALDSRTVEIHRANVMAKMEARSFSELVRMALLLERD